MEDYEAGGEEADLPCERLVPVDVPHQLHHGPGGVHPGATYKGSPELGPVTAARRQPEGHQGAALDTGLPLLPACPFAVLLP